MLQCRTRLTARIMFTVPAEGFADPLNAAIWRAAEALADGVCGPVAVVSHPSWPPGCGRAIVTDEVTGRVIDAITDVQVRSR